MNKGERVVLCLSVMCIANEIENRSVKGEKKGEREDVEVLEGVTHVHSLQFSTGSNV